MMRTIAVRLDDATIAELDAVAARAMDDLGGVGATLGVTITRSDVIRRLLAEGLDKRKAPGPAGGTLSPGQ